MAVFKILKLQNQVFTENFYERNLQFTVDELNRNYSFLFMCLKSGFQAVGALILIANNY